MRRLDALAYRLIADCRAHLERSPDEPHDHVLAMLVEARDETGAPLPDQQIRDELLTLLSAGHETTSNALSWTLWLLSQHPSVARTLQAEVDAVLEGRAPTIEDLGKLKFTRAVIDESMRLRPPVWLTGRMALEDHDIEGRHIAKDSAVLISPWVTQRSPELWDNPLGFDPERWLEPADRHPFAFFPFGGGARKCIGEAFAYLEATLVLAMIAQRMRLDLVPGHPVVPQPQITLGFEHGLLMQAAARTPTESGTV